MADYIPLISRAVSGLQQNTGENRRALYERARAALLAQLRGVTPALDEADITRERLGLEEAIRQVESEAGARELQPAPPHAAESGPSLRDQGLRNFRDTMAEAGGLGAAVAEASRSARAADRAVAAGTPHPERGEAASYFDRPGEEAFATAHASTKYNEAPRHPPAPAGAPPEEDDHYAPPVRSYGRMLKWAAVILVILGVAGAGYWQRQPITTMVASLRSSPLPAKTSDAPAVAPKFTERVETKNGSANPAAAPAATVAQKVVLADEDPSNPAGKRYVGSAIWRTETVSPGPGLAPELAVRADIDVPERHMRMTWSFRRNTDKELPASHTIEIMFTLPADFDQGSIGNVPGVLMKQTEQARGVPLAGLAVKVTNGYFLIGLSAIDVDKQRNLQLLKDEDWFDIPIVYTSGKRAILAIEKGTPGARAFEEAFRAWGE